MTEDNESSITTNVINPILHSLLLLPKLRETGAKFNILPRYVNSSRDLIWLANVFCLQRVLFPPFVNLELPSVSRSCLKKAILTQSAQQACVRDIFRPLDDAIPRARRGEHL